MSRIRTGLVGLIVGSSFGIIGWGLTDPGTSYEEPASIVEEYQEKRSPITYKSNQFIFKEKKEDVDLRIPNLDGLRLGKLPQFNVTGIGKRLFERYVLGDGNCNLVWQLKSFNNALMEANRKYGNAGVRKIMKEVIRNYDSNKNCKGHVKMILGYGLKNLDPKLRVQITLDTIMKDGDNEREGGYNTLIHSLYETIDGEALFSEKEKINALSSLCNSVDGGTLLGINSSGGQDYLATSKGEICFKAINTAPDIVKNLIDQNKEVHPLAKVSLYLAEKSRENYPVQVQLSNTFYNFAAEQFMQYINSNQSDLVSPLRLFESGFDTIELTTSEFLPSDAKYEIGRKLRLFYGDSWSYW